MERFLPGRHPIDFFGNGGFRLGGVSHIGALLITPSGARALPVQTLAALTPALVQALADEATHIDMTLFGCGPDIQAVPKALGVWLRERGIVAEPMSTNAAVRTYNVVLDENRRVAALLLPVGVAP